MTQEDIYDLEWLRQAKRASQGLELNAQDIMAYLVDVKNYRERTRIPERGVYDYSGWEDLAEMYPKTFGWLKDWAKMECTYFISLDGLERQEAILMTKAKTTAATTPLNVENVVNPMPTPPEAIQQKQEQEKKKGWLHR